MGALAENKKITVRSNEREEMIDISGKIGSIVQDSGKATGVCVLFVRHTTCGLTINENADPDVKSDMLGFLRKLIPQDHADFRHFEQNSDAHIKSSLVGPTVTVPFENGRLMLGRWQGIYLCEFDGPREREVLVTIL